MIKNNSPLKTDFTMLTGLKNIKENSAEVYLKA